MLFEAMFDICYLVAMFTIGVIMVRRSRDNQQYRLFGILTIILAVGDTFHLLPRTYGLCTGNLEAVQSVIGAGTYLMSIMVVLFYVFLFHVGCIRYKKQEKSSTVIAIYLLAAISIIFFQLPANHWLVGCSTLVWRLVRTTPLFCVSIIDIVFFARNAHKGDNFHMMPIALGVCLVSYLPIIFLWDNVPAIWALMLPKTIAHFWIVLIGATSRSKETYKSEV